jgi:hypothetical protein
VPLGPDPKVTSKLRAIITDGKVRPGRPRRERTTCGATVRAGPGVVPAYAEKEKTS